MKPNVVSEAGAIGLMQIMPGTGRLLGVRNLHSPNQNIHAGTRYLREQFDRFLSYPLALAAYHRGPGWVIERNNTIPHGITFDYVRSVIKWTWYFTLEEPIDVSHESSS